MITALQIKAARAMLDWNQEKLAQAASVSKKTIIAIEQSQSTPRPDTVLAIQTALEKQGIEFLPGNGVRPREEIITVYEGETAEEDLLNDIYETMLLAGKGNEILIYGLNEAPKDENLEGHALAKAQLNRLTKAGIQEKILSNQGNSNFIAPWHYYRWIPDMDGVETPIFIYGSKIALNNEKPPYKSIVIDNQLFADACRHLFYFAWDRASVPNAPEDDK